MSICETVVTVVESDMHVDDYVEYTPAQRCSSYLSYIHLLEKPILSMILVKGTIPSMVYVSQLRIMVLSMAISLRCVVTLVEMFFNKRDISSDHLMVCLRYLLLDGIQ